MHKVPYYIVNGVWRAGNWLAARWMRYGAAVIRPLYGLAGSPPHEHMPA